MVEQEYLLPMALMEEIAKKASELPKQYRDIVELRTLKLTEE